MLTLAPRLIPEKTTDKTDIFYPSEDGEPLAETFVHVDAILMLIVDCLVASLPTRAFCRSEAPDFG